MALFKHGMALLHATHTGDTKELRRLLDAGADVAAVEAGTARTALHLAVQMGAHRPTQLYFVAQNTAPRSCTSAPPHAAVSQNPHQSWGVVDILLDAGADISARDRNACTPLHRAACMGRECAVKILLDAGADTLARNLQGRTPRDLAEMGAFHEIVATLLAAERERSVAFAMGHQERLGVASLVRGLEPDVLRMVLDLV